MSVATTDMTGSVMAGPAETEARSDRDKDGFLIPQSPRSEDSIVTTEEEESELEEEFENVSRSDAGDLEEEDDNEGSLATEATARSRDS